MSIFSYNGVTLPYAACQDFREESVYEEETDKVLTKLDMTFQCVINSNYLGVVLPDLAAQQGANVSVGDVLPLMRARLLEPRKQISYTFNGVNMLPKLQQVAATGARVGKGFVDAKNGPLPQSCNLTYFTDSTYLVTYRVIAHFMENPGSLSVRRNRPAGEGNEITRNLAGNPVLYNRWTEIQTISDLGLSSYTRRGKFAIRSDNYLGLTVDDLRPRMAQLGVKQGYARTDSSYTVDPSGLSMSYEVTDQEQYKFPPRPAWKAEGEYTETGPVNGNPFRYGEVRIKLSGGPETPQDQLIITAIQVATAKIGLGGGRLQFPPAQGRILGTYMPFPEQNMLWVDMYNNTVEVRIKVIYPQATWDPNELTGRVADMARFGVATSRLSATPGSDGLEGQWTPNYQLYGAAGGLLLKAAAYWDPSILINDLNPVTGQFNVGRAPGQEGALGP